MQIILLFLACLLIAQLQTPKDNPRTQPDSLTTRNTDPVTTGTPKPKEYLVAGNNCFEDESCLTFVSVSKKLANEKGLIRLSISLSSKNPAKKNLVVYFFDDINLAKSFAEGKIHPTEIDLYAVGEYRFDEKEEYLKMRILDSRKSNLSGKRPEWRTVFKTSNK